MSGCMRRECTCCSPRAFSTSSSSSATPFLTGMAGRDGSGTHYCCRGGVRCWPGCRSSPRSGGGRRTTTRPWRVLVRPVRVNVSWSLCSKQSGKPYVRTRGQRVQRTRSAPARSLPRDNPSSPPVTQLSQYLGRSAERRAPQSHSSKKKACSNVRGSPRSGEWKVEN